MNRVLLNNVEHHDLKVAIRAGAAFGDHANQLPVFPSEFQELQREFPILFRRVDGAIDALVLLGFDAGENLFLGEHGWISRYVPAIQRRGPFSIAAKRPDDGADAGDLMIHVDLDDPRVGAADGMQVFREHGGNAPYLDEIAGVLRVLFEGMQSGRAVTAAIEAAGLLKPVSIEVDLADQSRFAIEDVLAIDTQALADLSGEPLERLHRSGVLHAATMAAASLGNIQTLVDRKNHRIRG